MKIHCLALFVLAMGICVSVRADDGPANLKVGDKAPEFSGITDENEKWNSKELVGDKVLVVYFYPADMTGGCTKQACQYRDAMDDFKQKDVEIVGVSGDSAENHRHFKEAHDLNFTLLADTDGKIAKAFGVETKPGFTNKANVNDREISFARDLTTMRWTFVIDKDGKIAYKNTSVNPAQDSEEVMKVVDQLEAKAQG